MFSFDLRTQPWIPVRDLDGNLLEVSLHQALTGAAEYVRIESENPLEVAALHRFLLAVLHRALKGPTTAKDNAQWFANGFPVADIDAYLERFHDRFDLFHPTYPFYQVGEMPADGYTQHWSRLSTEYGSGNTSPLFNYANRRGAEDTLDSWISPAQAARLVLEHQTFCLGGLIKRFITSAPAAPAATAAHTLVQGDNLHQTLCLNLVNYSLQQFSGDWVVWEAEPPKIAELIKDPRILPQGLVHRYTWLSRSIRLLPENFDDKTGVCVLAYASAERPKDYTDDPLVAYRASKKTKGAVYPIGLDADRAFWRDFAALLPHKKSQTADRIPTVINQAIETFSRLEQSIRPKRGLVVEVYGQINKQAKVAAWRSEAQRLPKAILSDRDVRTTVEVSLLHASSVWNVLNAACKVLAAEMLAASESKKAPKDLSNLNDSFPAKLIYWTNLERRFYQMLDSLVENYDETAVEKQWKGWLWETALEAWNVTVKAAGATPRVLKAAVHAQGLLLAQLHQFKPEDREGGKS